MARGTDTGIHHYGDIGLLNDYSQEIPCLQSFVCADRSTQRHDGGGTGFFQPLAQCGVGLAIGQYHKS